MDASGGIYQLSASFPSFTTVINAQINHVPREVLKQGKQGGKRTRRGDWNQGTMQSIKYLSRTVSSQRFY